MRCLGCDGAGNAHGGGCCGRPAILRVLGGATVLWGNDERMALRYSAATTAQVGTVPGAAGRTGPRPTVQIIAFPGRVLARPMGVAVRHGEAAVPVVARRACRGHAGLDVVHLVDALGRHDFFHRT